MISVVSFMAPMCSYEPSPSQLFKMVSGYVAVKFGLFLSILKSFGQTLKSA